jgi:hypothetical protein
MAKLGVINVKKALLVFSAIGFVILGVFSIFLATKYDFFSDGLRSMLDISNTSMKPFIIVEFILLGITLLCYGVYKIVKEVACVDCEEKNKENSLLIKCYVNIASCAIAATFFFGFSHFCLSVDSAIFYFVIAAIWVAMIIEELFKIKKLRKKYCSEKQTTVKNGGI